jgi:hypothetical protein
MAEDRQEPTWLASLREQQQGEQPRAAEDLQSGQVGQGGTVEDLREQMIQAEEELGYEEKPRLAQFFLDLQAWQRLVLAVLLLLDVALCGCMALVMAGRVMLPF